MLKAGVEPGEEHVPRLALGPGVVWFQTDGRFDVGRRPRVGSVIAASKLGDGVRYFGKFEQRAPQFPGHLARLVERQAGRQLHLQPQGALIQFGQEFPADGHAQPDDGYKRCATYYICNFRHGQHAFQCPAEAVLQPLKRSVVEDRPGFAEGHIGEAGNQGKGTQECAEKGIAHSISHRREQLRFGPLERKQRKVGGDDDEGGKENRPRNLCRCIKHIMLAQGSGRVRPPAFAVWPRSLR